MIEPTKDWEGQFLCVSYKNVIRGWRPAEVVGRCVLVHPAGEPPPSEWVKPGAFTAKQRASSFVRLLIEHRPFVARYRIVTLDSSVRAVEVLSKDA